MAIIDRPYKLSVFHDRNLGDIEGAHFGNGMRYQFFGVERYQRLVAVFGDEVASRQDFFF